MARAVTQAFAIGIELKAPAVITSLHNLDALREAAVLSAELRETLDERIQRVGLAPKFAGMLDSLDRVTTSAAAIWDRFATDPTAFSSVSPVLRRAPIVETLESTRTVLFAIEPEAQDEERGIETSPGGGSNLEARLGTIHPALAETYAGVITRYSERGPDYIRQASTSARELLDHLLILIAPDADVISWENRPENFENGKLKRNARLRFLFREHLEAEEYARMMNSDIELIQQVFYPLNGAVHSLKSPLAHQQLAMLIRRVEYAISLALEILQPTSSARAG